MSSPETILQFDVNNFFTAVGVIGGFVCLFSLVSLLLKERFYMSEALIAVIVGVIFSPHATNWIRPLDYAGGSQERLNEITLYFTHLVLDVQLVIAGSQLPGRYIRTEWKSLAILLGPGMCSMWVCTALIVWALVPNFPFLYALAVGSCVTPTDPILSNTIVKGKFADQNIPKGLQNIIVAESGANDGLGYPFLFLALYLIRFTQFGHLGSTGGAGKAMGYWFGVSWGYVIIMSSLYGLLVGYIFRKALWWTRKRGYVDNESLLVLNVALALFVCGSLGMIGADDVLASFMAGSAFNWDDRFRQETKDQHFQETIDFILNVGIFAWYGAVLPWSSFAHNNVIPIYRLIFLGIMVLLFRRLPFVLVAQKYIRPVKTTRHALFLGYFGPIGVSAIFYLYTSLVYLQEISVDDHERADAVALGEVFTVVVWFMAVCSIVGHGLSIPVGKLGFWSHRTISRTISRAPSSDSGEGQANGSSPFRVRGRVATNDPELEAGLKRDEKPSAEGDASHSSSSDRKHLPRPVWRIGGTLIREGDDGVVEKIGEADGPAVPVLNLPEDEESGYAARKESGNHLAIPGSAYRQSGDGGDESPATPVDRRSIRFGDEPATPTSPRD